MRSSRWSSAVLTSCASILMVPGCGSSTPTHSVDVLVYGKGRVLVDPAGGVYHEGSQITLMPIDNGASFSFWGGDASGDSLVLRVTVNRDLTIVALFEDDPKPSTTYDDPFLIAEGGQFLGLVLDNQFLAEGIANPLGTYGSTSSDTCIWNTLSTYGANFGNASAFSDNAATPPIIVNNGGFFAFCSTNVALSPREDTNDIARQVGRDEEARD